MVLKLKRRGREMLKASPLLQMQDSRKNNIRIYRSFDENISIIVETTDISGCTCTWELNKTLCGLFAHVLKKFA